MQPRRAPLFANSSARHVPWPSTCSLQPAGAQNPALQTQQCSRSAQAALRSALPLAGVQTAALLPRQAGNVASCKFSSFLEPLNRWPAARLVICYLLVSLSIFFFSQVNFKLANGARQRSVAARSTPSTSKPGLSPLLQWE